MTKNQETIEKKIEVIKKLAEFGSIEKIKFNDNNQKSRVLRSLIEKGWIVKQNEDYELSNINISKAYKTNLKYPSEDWLKKKIAEHLSNEGYKIIYIAWGYEKGTDVIGYNETSKRFINIEVKGGSGAKDSITPEGTNFYSCLGQCIVNISSSNNEDYALVFPYRTNKDKNYEEHYNIYGERWNSVNSNIKKKLNIKTYFIDKDGEAFISDFKNSVKVDSYKRKGN